MRSLWFVMPVHGRAQLAAICMRQLRRTCDALTAEGVEACAVVIGDDANLDTARELGFATVERDNRYLSRKFNDGIQAALDPDWNPRPVEFVVPIGSDDWVDHRLFLDLPSKRSVFGFKTISFVREDGQQISTTTLGNVGGCGIRIYPAALLEPLGFRPADEDRVRACDTSILYNVQRHHGDEMRVIHRHLHDRQIVDWKSPGQNVTPFDRISGRHRTRLDGDPFAALADFYPADALEDMAGLYGLVAA